MWVERQVDEATGLGHATDDVAEMTWRHDIHGRRAPAAIELANDGLSHHHIADPVWANDQCLAWFNHWT